MSPEAMKALKRLEKEKEIPINRKGGISCHIANELVQTGRALYTYDDTIALKDEA